MPRTVRFIFCIHIHQPVGNYSHVIQRVSEEAYLPFLEAMERHPDVKFVLHASGVLYEWFQKNAPEVLLRIRRMVEAGRVELLGGGMYEPVFSMLTPEDLEGQVEWMRAYLRKTFDVEPAGVWTPERVWEPQMASLLADAGVQYTMLDDAHFFAAGLSDAKLDGSFLTEDRGRLLRLFPIREALRYAIPYKEPAWTVEYLKERATESGQSVVVYADDGEKFGAWPGTHKHVYENGWLENFLRALEGASDVVKTTTFAEATANVPPAGRVYLPSTSYREMGEWSILPPAATDLRDLKQAIDRTGRGPIFMRFFTGGQWRNFRVKYPEANLMYARMTGLSKRVNAMPPRSAKRRDALRELYMAQCNCAYWHGVFGGLYLTHLRSAVYGSLIRAETMLEEEARDKGLPGSRVEDYDLDGQADVRLWNAKLNLFVCPARGASVFELDVREKAMNLTATLARRREAYHADLAKAVQGGSDAKSIHDQVVVREKGLENYLKYDAHLRGSLIDHFFDPGASVEAIDNGTAEAGDFVDRAYEPRISRRGGRLYAAFSARGRVHGRPVAVKKEVMLEKSECEFQVEYTIENLDTKPLAAIFGVEFNVSEMSASQPGAHFHVGDGNPIADLRTRGNWNVDKGLWIRDDWHGLDLSWQVSRPSRVFTYPINTVSLSERGIELTYQSTVVVPSWDLALKPGETWSVVLTHRIEPKRE